MTAPFRCRPLAFAALALLIASFLTSSIRKFSGGLLPSNAKAASTSRLPSIGFASHGLTEAEFLEMKSAGATFVRTDFSMTKVQPASSDSFDWHDLDTKVAAAKAHGLKVLGILDYSPKWNAHAGCVAKAPEQCAPADITAFARFAAATAAHFPDVTHWEIWNEPNLRQFWSPSPDVGDYVRLLNATYAAIKREAPGDVILAGAISRANDVAGIEISPRTFVRSMYANGATFDVLSLHPYTYPFSPDTENPGNGWRDVAAVRAIMVANGDSDKKIWITEIGVPTCGPGTAKPVDAQPFADGDYMTEEAQQRILSKALREARSASFIDALFIYEIRDDNSNDPSTRENCFGLFRSDDSAKPASGVFEK